MGRGIASFALATALALAGAHSAAQAAPEQEILCKTLAQQFESARIAYRGQLTTTISQASKPSAVPDPLASSRDKLAVALVKHGDNSREAAAAWLAVAVAYRDAGKYGEANAGLDHAEALLQGEAKASELAGDVQRERATILVRLGKLEAALAQYQTARGIFIKALGPEAVKVGLTYQNESWMLRDLERYDAALVALASAEALYRRHQERAADLVEVVIETSVIHARLEEKIQAFAAAERAAQLGIRTLGPSHRSTARALHHVGISSRRLANFAPALVALAATYEIYLSHGPEARGRAAEALEDASLTLSTGGCFEYALATRREAVDLYVLRFGETHDQAADAMHRMGRMLQEMKHLEAAEKQFRIVAGIYENTLGPDSPRIAAVYADLAAVLTQLGHHDESVEQGLRSLRALQRDGKNPLRLRQALLSLARGLDGQGNRGGAVVIAKMAVNMQQEIRAQNRGLSAAQAKSLGERYRELYLYLAELLVRDRRFAEAQRVIDLIKEQELLDFVRGGRPELTGVNGRAALTKTEQKATETIAALIERPVATSREYEDLVAIKKTRALAPHEEARLDLVRRAHFENAKQFGAAIRTVLERFKFETADVQQEITKLALDMHGQMQLKLKLFPRDVVFLQIASLRDAVHLFVTTKTAQLHKSVPVPRDDFSIMAFAAWDAVAHQRDDAQAKLKAVYDVVIGPIESDLKASGSNVIILNLEGFMRYVPVAALYSGKRYLIEDYALTLQTPVAATVYQTPERSRASAVGFGVTEKFGEFSELPGVAAELESIFDGNDASGIFAGNPMINADFNEVNFAAALEGAPQIVHVASHFLLTPEDQAKSFLLMGGGSQLTLDRLGTDPQFRFLAVDLLTLSACDTAGQVSADGKEIESFATLAQKSGASSVMATLWPIADGPTGSLMTEFYRGLIVSRLDKATALRHAQLSLISGAGLEQVAQNRTRGIPDRSAQSFDQSDDAPEPLASSHPYFWSSFIIMGNWL